MNAKKNIKVDYLFSSPLGDLPLDGDALARSFLISPGKPHPRLKLKHYFEALHRFVERQEYRALSDVLSKTAPEKIVPQDIQKILIRSEKHGVLYHFASVEVFFANYRVTLAVNTAVSENGKNWLDHEFEVIRSLTQFTDLPYLPREYYKDDVKIKIGSEDETLTMCLTEWFENYHEWHLSNDEKNAVQRIHIWDQRNGYRLASTEESYNIYREASKILTLYYNTRDFRQIYPWHHAAGDFVVKPGPGKTMVKLTTARDYEPVIAFIKASDIDPTVALTYFFLTLTIKMRLDKLDGTGDVAWAGRDALPAVVDGFFEGLLIKEQKNDYHLGQVKDLVTLFKGFNEDELQRLLSSMMDLFRGQDPGDFSVIQSNQDSHAKELSSAIQNCPA